MPNSVRPPEGWVQVEAPAWLWGGNMIAFLEQAGLQVRRPPGRSVVHVRTTESYSHTNPDLIRLSRGLGPKATPNGLAEFSSLAEDDIELDAQRSAQRAVSEWPSEASELVDLAVYYQLATAAAPSARIPSQARNAWESIREITILEDQTPAFPNAGVYAISRSDVLVLRMKLMSVLLRAQHDEAVASGDIRALTAAHNAGSLATFAAGADLHSGLYLLDPYVGAVLGATSPGVWGFGGYRGRGAILYSFGNQVSGTAATARELLRTVFTPGAEGSTQFAPWSPDVVPDALLWWTTALNSLFAVLSDWAVFADVSGIYQPSKHLQAVATVEQVFRRIVSIQTTYHDLNARRVLLFTVLDTLQSLTGRPIENHCDLTFALRTLERLQEAIPTPAANLLLAGAERACDALRQVQDGFFLSDPGGHVLAQPSIGRSISRAEAAAQYLKILRDATHGHGAHRAGRAEIYGHPLGAPRRPGAA